jgi:periplasmic protein CpxP/Spy
MKTLQRLAKAATLCVALMAGTSAFAQERPTGPGQGGQRATPAERAEMQVKRYEKQLDLTPEQATKIRTIVLASVQEGEKLRTPGQRPDREAMQALAQKRSDEIKAVLTPAQQEKFAQALAQQMERGNQGRGQGQGAQAQGQGQQVQPQGTQDQGQKETPAKKAGKGKKGANTQGTN